MITAAVYTSVFIVADFYNQLFNQQNASNEKIRTHVLIEIY